MAVGRLPCSEFWPDCGEGVAVNAHLCMCNSLTHSLVCSFIHTYHVPNCAGLNASPPASPSTSHPPKGLLVAVGWCVPVAPTGRPPRAMCSSSPRRCTWWWAPWWTRCVDRRVGPPGTPLSTEGASILGDTIAPENTQSATLPAMEVQHWTHSTHAHCEMQQTLCKDPPHSVAKLLKQLIPQREAAMSRQNF